MDRKLLDILVCPASRQPLSLLDATGLEKLNAAVAAGQLRRDDGNLQGEPLREALVSHDRRRVYRVDDGIPVLLIEESLDTSALDGFARA